MKLQPLIYFLCCLVFLFLSGPQILAGADSESKVTREPVLAGTWYPGNPEKLSELIKEYLSKAQVEPLKGELVGLIAPHAGYMYSGQVAAYAYKLLDKASFRRVIIIGPSHYVGFKGISVDLKSGYRTPLGTVPVDQAFVKDLLNTSSQIQSVPQAHSREHSLEIQIPFLQTTLQDFRLVPVLMRDDDYETCSLLAESLIKAVRKSSEKTLIIASTDLSHFYTGEKAKVLDQQFIEQVRSFDPKGLLESMESGRCEACGGGPTVTTMLAARELGAKQAVILRYANSGDVTRDYAQVVGYLSAALVKN